MAALDLVDWPANRTLALSGSAGALSLPLALRNSTAAPVQLEDVSLAEVRLVGGQTPLRLDPAPAQVSLSPNGVTRAKVRLRLDPGTPPGRYEGQVRFAGLSRSVAIEVLPQVKLDVRPDPLVVDAAAGREQTLAVAVENRGNVALTIDLKGAYPLGEEAPIAPHRLEEIAAGGQPLAAIFDRIVGRATAPVLKPHGEIELHMPDGAAALAPGEALNLAVSLRLPADLSPTARYHVFAPLYASDLHIVIVTAAKSPLRAAPARRTKGAKA